MPYKDPAKQATARKKWYAKHKEEHKQRRIITICAKEDYLHSMKSKPCMDCGKRFHYSAMDFDHVRGEKLFNLSKAARNYGWETIKAEIAKCDLVCANCHRVRSFERSEGLKH